MEDYEGPDFIKESDRNLAVIIQGKLTKQLEYLVNLYEFLKQKKPELEREDISNRELNKIRREFKENKTTSTSLKWYMSRVRTSLDKLFSLLDRYRINSVYRKRVEEIEFANLREYWLEKGLKEIQAPGVKSSTVKDIIENNLPTEEKFKSYRKILTEEGLRALRPASQKYFINSLTHEYHQSLGKIGIEKVEKVKTLELEKIPELCVYLTVAFVLISTDFLFTGDLVGDADIRTKLQSMSIAGMPILQVLKILGFLPGNS